LSSACARVALVGAVTSSEGAAEEATPPAECQLGSS
jgi:hypothetical protein